MAKYLGKRRRADYMRACFALSFIILQTLDLGSGHGKPLSTEPLRDNLHQGALKSPRYKRGIVEAACVTPCLTMSALNPLVGMPWFVLAAK